MSDKNSEGFNEYIDTIEWPEFSPITIDHVKAAWNHQQKKIDELDEILKERLEFLEKRCVFLYRKLKKAGFNKEEIEKGWE